MVRSALPLVRLYILAIGAVRALNKDEKTFFGCGGWQDDMLTPRQAE